MAESAQQLEACLLRLADNSDNAAATAGTALEALLQVSNNVDGLLVS